MAYLIKPDGKTTYVAPHNKVFELDELYSILKVDTIEVLPLGPDTILIMDEEGKLKNLPNNSIATQMTEASINGDGFDDEIVGPVLLVNSREFK